MALLPPLIDAFVTRAGPPGLGDEGRLSLAGFSFHLGLAWPSCRQSSGFHDLVEQQLEFFLLEQRVVADGVSVGGNLSSCIPVADRIERYAQEVCCFLTVKYSSRPVMEGLQFTCDP